MKHQIHDVQILTRQEFVDARGAVRHGLRANEGFMTNQTIGEVYFSQVNPNAVKAWHLHKKMLLRYVCVSGSVLLGLYDDRPDSPTRGVSMKIHMPSNGDNYNMVLIPPGIWNGFRAYAVTGNPVHPAVICNIPSMPYDQDANEMVKAAIDDIPWGMSWGDYDVAG